jgi:hypothetical protein
MLQTVDGKEVFIVEFETMPELPINWATEEEKPYALALAIAISTGVINKPGKYGLEVDNPENPTRWDAYEMIEL